MLNLFHNLAKFIKLAESIRAEMSYISCNLYPCKLIFEQGFQKGFHRAREDFPWSPLAVEGHLLQNHLPASYAHLSAFGPASLISVCTWAFTLIFL